MTKVQKNLVAVLFFIYLLLEIIAGPLSGSLGHIVGFQSLPIYPDWLSSETWLVVILYVGLECLILAGILKIAIKSKNKIISIFSILLLLIYLFVTYFAWRVSHINF